MRDLKIIENELLAQVGQFKITMRRTVNEAVRIGELLSEARPHLVKEGAFLAWCEKIGIKRQSAENYLHLFEYRHKIPNVGNLQEAYKLIETEEARRRQREAADSMDRIKAYKETGRKPEGWSRADDYRMNKTESDEQFQARTAKIFDEKREQTERKPRITREEINELSAGMDMLVKANEEKQRLLGRMRLTGNNATEPIYDALLEYLLSKPETERLEVCHNIIKFCKGLANEYQRQSAGANT
jgi:hypothetical protein